MSEENVRVVPTSDLDFQMLTTEPQWGKDDIHEDIKSRAILKTNWVNEKTGEVVRSDVLNQWAIGSISTRDVRLGNLDRWNGEFEVAQFHQNFAMDCLRAFMEDDDSGHTCGAPWVASNYVENIIELSHSKQGFFRKLMNSFETTSRYIDMGPPKKNMLGMSKGGKQ